MMAEMPYRIKPKTLMAASVPQDMQSASRDMQVNDEEPAPYTFERREPGNRSHGKEDRKKTTDSAAQYLDRVMGSKQEAHQNPRQRQYRQTPWQSFQFGNDLEIKIRKRLTPAQKHQLALAGQLLQSMLDKE